MDTNYRPDTLPMFQRNRYYTFERGGFFYVSRFFRGSNASYTRKFDCEDDRREWVAENCRGFVAFKPEHDNHDS